MQEILMYWSCKWYAAAGIHLLLKGSYFAASSSSVMFATTLPAQYYKSIVSFEVASSYLDTTSFVRSEAARVVADTVAVEEESTDIEET